MCQYLDELYHLSANNNHLWIWHVLDWSETTTTSFYWYSLAANKGNAVAQCILGNAYMNGHGVKKDVEQAKHWYTKAAEQGHGDAVKRLKEMESRTIS